MSKIIPFGALLPNFDQAPSIICPPYDIVDILEARAIAASNKRSFLHITRAEVDLPPDISPYDDAVYSKALENYTKFQKDRTLLESPAAYYIYRLISKKHIQTGIACGVSVDEYEDGRIKRHELTHEEKVVDRTKHSLAIGAHAEPVFLVHRDSPALAEIIHEQTRPKPLYKLKDNSGTEHILWRTDETGLITDCLAEIEALYIADGHHRSESAKRVRDAKRDRNRMHDGTETYNYFPAVLFPASEVRIYDYGWGGEPAKRPLAKVSMADVMDLVDKSGVMPPKTTWFAPKLTSGLFVYKF